MKTRLWLASVALAAPCCMAAQAPLELPPQGFGSIQVKSAGIGTMDISHLEVVVNLGLTPLQSGTLKGLQLCSLRLNGLPVFAAPVEKEIDLEKGKPIELPPLTVSIFYHDLYTAKPLEEMLDKQVVEVRGELVSDLQVGFLAKLALHSQHPRIVLDLNQQVPVTIGVSPLQRRLALGLLSAIDGQMTSDSTVAQLVDKLRPQWIQDLEQQAQSSLVVIQSNYAMDVAKVSYPVNTEALGFRMPTGEIATSAEMLNPWKYDAEFLSQMAGGQAKLVKNSHEIRISTLDHAGPPLSLSASDFAEQARGTPDEEKVTVVGKSREQIHLLRRATPASMAVLTLRAAGSAHGFVTAPEAVLGQSAWERVVVFRLRRATASGDRTVEPLQLAAKRDGDSIRLEEPVDESVFGSPILAPEGVIGIVQDEWTGTVLPVDLRKSGGGL